MKKVNLKEQQYNETHELIYSTVVNLLQSEEYDTITVRQICDACHISIGNFYHHFKNKEECLNEGYFIFDENVEKVIKAKTPFKNKEERLIYLFTIELSAIEQRGWKMASKLFEKQLQFDSPNILDENRFFYQELIRTSKDYIQQYQVHIEAEELVKQLLRISRGCIYDWCLHRGDYALVDETLEMIKRMLKTY